jgi:hypothetical protein
MIVDTHAMQRMVSRLCRNCGIAPSDIEDASAEVLLRVRRMPPRKRYGTALHTLRVQLARSFGQPRRLVPRDLLSLHAIGDYTRALRRYEEREAASWQAGFDYHSRQFAAENGVCPRCSRVVDFAAGATCDCGFPGGGQEPGVSSQWPVSSEEKQ